MTAPPKSQNGFERAAVESVTPRSSKLGLGIADLLLDRPVCGRPEERGRERLRPKRYFLAELVAKGIENAAVQEVCD